MMETLHQGINNATLVASTIPEALRVALLEAATKLVSALQKPEDALTKLAYWVRGIIFACHELEY